MYLPVCNFLICLVFLWTGASNNLTRDLFRKYSNNYWVKDLYSSRPIKFEPNLFPSLFLSGNNFLHFRLLSLPKDKQKRRGKPDIKAKVMKWGTGVACAHSPSHFAAFHSSVLSCYLKQLESAVQPGWGFWGALDRASNSGPWKGVEVIHVTTKSGSVLKNLGLHFLAGYWLTLRVNLEATKSVEITYGSWQDFEHPGFQKSQGSLEQPLQISTPYHKLNWGQWEIRLKLGGSCSLFFFLHYLNRIVKIRR